MDGMNCGRFDLRSRPNQPEQGLQAVPLFKFQAARHTETESQLNLFGMVHEDRKMGKPARQAKRDLYGGEKVAGEPNSGLRSERNH